ncbi:ABC transporter permease [Paenibacillus aurantius]|uniref:ABC transporter permease n=1 Tax=Paenibacillus aurantius TaxID=2918900 RepID=A0AA96LF05_9BACL|nr:ABC transporter permease [Paenibacillus aurantius]WNQ12038.1 ABC transporter permease [Paenibacillus aurantius]
MVTINRLFARRVRSYWVYQAKALATVMDWTVALYIVVPALLFAGYQYSRWWMEAPGWLAWVPLPLWYAGLFLLVLTGKVRYYVEAGDQLFLRQGTNWVRKLMARGMLYSLGAFVLRNGAALALLAPLLIKGYGLDALVLPRLLTVLVPVTFLLALAGQWGDFRWAGLKKWGLGLLLLMAGGVVFSAAVQAASAGGVPFWLAAALLLASLPYAAGKRLEQKGTFLHDADRELEAKLALTKLLLGEMAARKPLIRRRRPLLFRSSNRLFRKRTAENGLAEAQIKAFFRSRSALVTYLQLTGVCLAGARFVPHPVNWAIWPAAALLFTYYAKLYVNGVNEHPFIGLFRWKEGVRFTAMHRTTLGIMLPGFLAVSAVIGFTTLPWWGALGLLAGSAGAAYLTVSLLLTGAGRPPGA